MTLSDLFDSSRPVHRALSCACVENWRVFSETIIELSAQTSRPPEDRLNEAEVIRGLQEVLIQLKNVTEILRWVRYPKPLQFHEACQRVEVFSEIDKECANALFLSLQRLPEGRPAQKRQSHVHAFEYMLKSSKNTMGKAVPKFCPCGNEHGPKCYQQLKAGIHDLTKMLRKYAPEIVAQYEALHPNRAQKQSD